MCGNGGVIESGSNHPGHFLIHKLHPSLGIEFPGAIPSVGAMMGGVVGLEEDASNGTVVRKEMLDFGRCECGWYTG